MDVNDVNVNVNVVASSNHAKLSTSSYSLSSSEPSITNNVTSTNQSSSNINVINVCDGNDKTNTNHGIIITETHGGAGFYDAIKLEENGGATAIIYETIVIENPPAQNQGLVSFVAGNNNKLMANKNVSLDGVGNGGIIVLTGSLNELLLSQNGHVITNMSQSSNGAGANIKCLNDVNTNPNHIQSIVLNLNSQSSASSTPIGAGQMTPGNQKSIMLAINPNQQVSFILDLVFVSSIRAYKPLFHSVVVVLVDAGRVFNVLESSHFERQLAAGSEQAATASSADIGSVCDSGWKTSKHVFVERTAQF